MGKRRMDSDLHRIKLDKGTVYQTSKGGNYYFRYQVRGERKCVNQCNNRFFRCHIGKIPFLFFVAIKTFPRKLRGKCARDFTCLF